MKVKGNLAVFAALLTTLFFWASAFAGIRAGLKGYSPGHLALLRFIVASIVLAGYGLIKKTRLPDLKDIPAVLFIGFIGITVYHVSLSYGETTVSAGAASILVNSTPIFTALLAIFLLKERLSLLNWTGILVSFIGISLITIGEGKGFHFSKDAILILISAIASSLYIVLQKPYLNKYSALEFTSYTIWAGTLFMLAFAPGLLGQLTNAPLNATLAIVYMGIFPAAVAYVTWAYFLSKISASRSVSFLYFVPVLAFLIAWIWLGEIPSVLSVVGGLIALSGVILVNLKKQNKNAAVAKTC